MSAGYSGTPLAKKLGVASGMTMYVVNAPPRYAQLLAPLPPDVKRTARLPRTPRFVHLFTTHRKELVERLTQLRLTLAQDGMIWVSWPKKSSKAPTDITEDVIRSVALPMGFVDVKVCAVDDTWSGLKLVIRRELRAK